MERINMINKERYEELDIFNTVNRIIKQNKLIVIAMARAQSEDGTSRRTRKHSDINIFFFL